MSEAAMNDNNNEFDVYIAIEDDHIAYHHHLHRPENGPVAADPPASPNEIELPPQIPRENHTENRSQLNSTAIDMPKDIIEENEEEHREILAAVQKIKNKCFSNFYALLTFSVLTAGSTYTSLFNLNHSYAKNESFNVRDIIFRLPNAFYSTMFMTFAFTVSMVGIGVPLWSMVKKWPFGSWAIPLLALAAFFGSYVFAMRENVPKFWVTIESFKLSSFCLVWLYGLSLILIPLTVLFAAKLILSIFRKLNGPQRE